MKREATQLSQYTGARLRHRFWALLPVLSGVSLVATTSGAQTLFARPDTTPNYTSYRDIEECKNAIFRVAEDTDGHAQSIWWDTASVLLRNTVGKGQIDHNGRYKKLLTLPRPDVAIQAGKACLAHFNPDTTDTKDLGFSQIVIETLLMANRDDDAYRYADRLLDSMRLKSATEYKNGLQLVLEWYLQVRPIRYDAAKRMHARIMTTIEGDSLYRTIRADRSLSIAAEVMGDTIYSNELAWRAIRASDAMPVEERKRAYDSVLWMGWLASKLAHFTDAEGFDSLAVSTVAYNLYKANTVARRVYGGDVVLATDARVQPMKVPDLVGDYYYTSSPGTSASYTKHGAVPPGTLPVKGRINFITSWPSFCHSEGKKRPPENAKQLTQGGLDCAKTYNMIRMYKELYPDLEIIVLSDTYGTVGEVGPLSPADEADTLAKLFLGHGRAVAHLVVENTPIFHVDAPDGRRIDLPTPQMEQLGQPRELWDGRGGVAWLVDKDGYVVNSNVRGLGDGAGSGDYFDRFITILKNRPSKQ